MKTLAAQYLEYAPPGATPAAVRDRLRRAFEMLPISIVLLGWNLPERLEAAVAEETAAHHVRLYRWHPLLASDAGFAPPDEWLTVNARGEAVGGFKGLPEFTFLCPNRSDVQEWIAERLDVALSRGLYHGLFFDRMRFPSPAEDFDARLTCFCSACRRRAADAGLDLEAVRAWIHGSLAEASAAAGLVRGLLDPDPHDATLRSLLEFRARSITRVVRAAARQVRNAGLDVGLDCFSPALTRMVGQDLPELSGTGDWIKIMTYPRAFGPAGLPFELLGLARRLIDRGLDEADAMRLLSEASGLPVPETQAHLAEAGLRSGALRVEIQRGHAAGIRKLLAGIALVEMKGVNESGPEQVDRDLEACHGADGLVLSWDLWHIPDKRLQRVRSALPSSD